MRIPLLVLLSLSLTGAVFGQPAETLSLPEAYGLLEANYPALRNGDLLERIYQQDLELIGIARRPTLQLKGEARLQSESVSLQGGSDMMPINIDQPLYSVKGYAEANYLLYDGGLHAAQRAVKAAELATRQKDIAVATYGLRTRINALFTSIDLLRSRADLLATSLAALAARRERIAAGVANGVVLESELKQLDVRKLELLRQQDELAYRETGLLATLGTLIGRELTPEVQLQIPDLPAPDRIPELNRPEQTRFASQRSEVLARADLLAAERRPKVSAFAQAGIGAPNPLNFLDRNIAPYALIGVGAAWSITDWDKETISRQQLALRATMVDNEAETFRFNQEAAVAGYRAEVERLRAQLERTAAIAELEAEILRQFAVQLDEGVITTTDYLLQLNAELAAREQLRIYAAELRQTQLDFWNQRGAKL